MPAFHLLRCMVALGGDQGNTVYRHRARPIVFPELPILQYLHGEDAISDIAVVGTWETTNDEVLARLNQTYASEAVQAVFPGNRPRLPLSDASIPRCTLPIYKPRPTRPENPDPKLKPLDQFTITADTPMLDAPPLPDEDEPTADEIAAHAQDDADDMGLADPGTSTGLLGPELPDGSVMASGLPRPEDIPHIVRDTLGRGSSRDALASRASANLPDVNAGGSHAPGYQAGHAPRSPSAAQESKRRG